MKPPAKSHLKGNQKTTNQKSDGAQDGFIPPKLEDIAICVYLIYEMEGHPDGRRLEHWRQAEWQLILGRMQESIISRL